MLLKMKTSGVICMLDSPVKVVVWGELATSNLKDTYPSSKKLRSLGVLAKDIEALIKL